MHSKVKCSVCEKQTFDASFQVRGLLHRADRGIAVLRNFDIYQSSRR